MFNKLRLSMKIAGGFGIVLVALLTVGGLGFTRITGVQTVVTDLTKTHIPLLQVISAIDVSATEQDLAVTQYALHKEPEFLSKFDTFDKLVDKKFEELKILVKGDQTLVDEGWLELIEKMAVQHDIFVKACNALAEAVKAGKSSEEWNPIADEVQNQSVALMTHIDGLLDLNTKESNTITALSSRVANSARISIGTVSVIALVVGLLLAFFITRGIVRPINRIIEGLNEGAEQIASASGQVSSSSQSLAEGSSEQAASIEETSSSLEELSSMTKQNAGNANEADNLMQEANRIVAEANGSMDHLNTSMEEITKASGETSKIIKTIDEIAFQTNLLALNAAVEAARAGEAGAGFAVVADEVRNLAMRAADAAKNTAELIETTVKKVNDGTALVTQTNEAFASVAKSATKVGDLVSEIAAASNEQAQGIGQINTAVTEMDKVTQQNAAGAEESASASEEMNAQAEQMKAIVNELAALVEGGGDLGRKSSGIKTTAPVMRPHDAPGGRGKINPQKTAKAVAPAQLIPFGEDDFQDF